MEAAMHLSASLESSLRTMAGLDIDALFMRHSPYVAAVALRLLGRDDEVDDVVQDVFLQAVGANSMRHDVADLLLAADVARRSRHSSEALGPLRRVVRAHRGDERAPLAAFTLGRVLLEELGEPADAADAFAEVRALAPRGPLVEDALAREVEARSRAGESDRAQALAREYLREFPQGLRARAVRRFGGLE
jgi:transmembrane sensor